MKQERTKTFTETAVLEHITGSFYSKAVVRVEKKHILEALLQKLEEEGYLTYKEEPQENNKLKISVSLKVSKIEENV